MARCFAPSKESLKFLVNHRLTGGSLAARSTRGKSQRPVYHVSNLRKMGPKGARNFSSVSWWNRAVVTFTRKSYLRIEEISDPFILQSIRPSISSRTRYRRPEKTLKLEHDGSITDCYHRSQRSTTRQTYEIRVIIIFSNFMA